MKIALPVTAAALLTLLFLPQATAQTASTALTNADVVHLVAIHVSDQTVIAVINEAKATQFDLSPQAVGQLATYGLSPAIVAAMRQPSTPAASAHGEVSAQIQSPSGGVQTLAAAAAEAATIKHGWALSTNLGASRASTGETTYTSPGQSEGERQAEYQQVAKKDEAYWKDRMRGLRSTLDADQTYLDSATAREHELNVQVNKSPDNSDYVRDRLQRAELERQWQDAINEVKRLTAAVTNDKREIARAEDEARRAGVPPGWLRP